MNGFFGSHDGGCGCGCDNLLWILLILCCCGGDGCNCCDIIPLLLILSCCCGKGGEGYRPCK